MDKLFEFVWEAGRITLFLVAIKALLGFRFPWESTVKAKKEMANLIENTKIPPEAREEMSNLLQWWN